MKQKRGSQKLSVQDAKVAWSPGHAAINLYVCGAIQVLLA